MFKSNGKYPVEKYVQNEITVNCHRLDTVMAKNNIPRVDIIWMDLQGAELLALKGLGKFMKTVKYMNTEVSHYAMYHGQVLFDELNNFVISNGFRIKNNIRFNCWQEDIIYENIDIAVPYSFDIVIPIGPKDEEIIYEQIEYTKKNIIGYRNIYIIPYDDTIMIDGCITISEKIFPFTMETLILYKGNSDRNGWYLQQLLKFYAGFVIPDILDTYLVLDADIFFMKPIIFMENNKCLYNYGIRHNEPYFVHMKKLHPDFNKCSKMSGICDHMILETKYIKEIIDIVEKYHNKPFYTVFIENITDYEGSGASEFEIYFNYVLRKYPDKIKIRKLKNMFGNKLDDRFDYVTLHWHTR